jgi:hypothetical protein
MPVGGGGSGNDLSSKSVLPAIQQRTTCQTWEGEVVHVECDLFGDVDAIAVTSGFGNRASLATNQFSLITDVTIVTIDHNFSSQHIFKVDALSEEERLKNDLYWSD